MKRLTKFLIVFLMVFIYLSGSMFTLAVGIQNELSAANTLNEDTTNSTKENVMNEESQNTLSNELENAISNEIQNTSNNEKRNVIHEEIQNSINAELKTRLENKQTINRKGELTVELNLRLPTQKNLPVARLTKDGVVVFTNRGSKQDTIVSYDFGKLDVGEYTLTIQGNDYLTYEQNIIIDDYHTQITLSNSHDVNDVLRTSGKQYGVIALGDINQDGKIDTLDEEEMIKQIESRKNLAKYDLNGDGIVDIIDLSYIAYNEKSNILATPIKTIITDNIVASSDTSTVVDETNGSIKDIFSDNGKYISLAPKNEGEISEANPVVLTVDLSANKLNVEGFVIAPPSDTNAITDGTIAVEYEENGETKTMQVPIVSKSRMARSAIVAATATVEADGSIVIHLNGQIAIKKIVIKVTQTQSNKLADIGKVEFLNNMEARIPAPELDIPEGLSAIPNSKKFSVSWKKVSNITGYEVVISALGKSETISTESINLQVSSFLSEKIKNGTQFTVKVRAVNGDWKSGYSKEITVTPTADKKPDAPENVNVTAGYRSLSLSWKDMEDTDSYTLYYREHGTMNYQKIENITVNNYKIVDLKDQTKYEIYLTGTNKLGTSAPSAIYIGTTESINPPITSNYKLMDNKEHVVNVAYPSKAPENKRAVIDGDYTTAWSINSWEAGGYNDTKSSPIVEFDQAYKMNRVVVVDDGNQKYDYFYARTRYWDADGVEHVMNGYKTKKTATNGKIYYEFNFPEAIVAKKIQINFALYLAYGDGKISIAEMKFYYFDEIEQDIENLYVDQLHLSLNDTVTIDQINNLETKLNTKEESSGEYNPKRDLLQKELDNARNILLQENLAKEISVDPTIRANKDGHLGFGGLNSWQPIGITAREGETIVIYVGNASKNIGDEVPLTLTATQFHAESGVFMAAINQRLVVGKNEIVIPHISSMGVEHGGSIYISYTGNSDTDQYKIRISGGQTIPTLNIKGIEDETKKKELIKEYILKLEERSTNIQELHNQEHAKEGTNCDYDYSAQNCILNATEIVLDQMMYSVAGDQILKPLTGTIEQKTEKLYRSLEAMNDMMEIFYQSKGLSKSATADAKNKYPSQHLNIRYHRMFAGAFMYASGNHIGIEYGSVSGLATAVPVKSDENGKYESGNYFGWGIAHEIGHCINQGTYAIAEITNNYFSILAQAKETNDSVRFSYDEVYKKVTSNTQGKSSNVFTSLAMYWQLHLAYDKDGYNFKIYDKDEDMFNNLVFARIDTYARDITKAPKPAGISLTLDGDKDNNFMRLAIAATGKDILQFFIDWGFVPDTKTVAYASQFEKETRRIKYANDEARDYEISGGKELSADAKVTASIANKNGDHINDTQIHINLGMENADQNAILGYEIYRNGKSIGFVQAGQTEFIDTINVNNRVYTYEIVAVDKLLNIASRVTLDPIKVQHDGSLSKEKFEISTNMTSPEDTKEPEDQNCATMPTIQAISKLANNDYTDVYTGTAAKNSEIVVDLGEQLSIIGVKLTKANQADSIPNYDIYVSNDKTNWELVKSGAFTFDDRTATVYFDKFEENKDPRVEVKEAAYVKVVLKNNKEMSISLSEIDVIGKPGDNVEIFPSNGIGILKEDYVLEEATNTIIPKGSFIITGSYSGHPAYNAIKLYDQEGNLVSGTQVIFAQEPSEGNLGNITEGTWIYYITPEEMESITLPTAVRAELYRVDDAITLEGERLVSDTLTFNVPEVLPEITIQK